MNVVIAGQTRDYPEGLTVSRLIEAEKIATPQYVSVSLNDEFVRSEDFGSTVLQEGDSVEFLYFMGGGAADAFHQ